MIPVFSEHFFQDNSCKINTRNIHEKSPETIYPGIITITIVIKEAIQTVIIIVKQIHQNSSQIIENNMIIDHSKETNIINKTNLKQTQQASITTSARNRYISVIDMIKSIEVGPIDIFID